MNIDKDQLELPNLRHFCLYVDCSHEVDYQCLKVDGQFYCTRHWEEWSNKNYRLGKTVDVEPIKDFSP